MPRSRLLFRGIKELEKKTKQVSLLFETNSSVTIDWEAGGNFHIDINSNVTIDFQNTYDTHTVILVVRNTSTSNRSITFPSQVKKDENFEGTLEGNTTSIFTFVQTNGVIYVAEVIGY